MKRLGAVTLILSLIAGPTQSAEVPPVSDLFSPSWLTRISAVESYARLSAQREDMAAIVVDLLAEPDPAVRQQVVERLVKWNLGRRTTLQAIALGLRDEDPEVRLSAIHAAGQLGKDGAALRVALEPLLLDPESDLRPYAALALAAIQYQPPVSGT